MSHFEIEILEFCQRKISSSLMNLMSILPVTNPLVSVAKTFPFEVIAVINNVEFEYHLFIRVHSFLLVDQLCDAFVDLENIVSSIFISNSNLSMILQTFKLNSTLSKSVFNLQ